MALFARSRRALAVLPFIGLLLASNLAGQVLPAGYDEVYRGLREAAPDPGRGAAVRDLLVQYDAGSIELTEGDLFLFTPVGGATWGAVFVGQGRFSLAAPIPIETAQLGKFFGTDSLAVPIRSAVFLFSDGMAPFLFGSLDWEARELPSEARREIEEAIEYVSDEDGWIDRSLMLPLLNRRTAYFRAHMAESRSDPIIYTVNPYEEEEVSVARRGKAPGPKRPEVVARFHRSADYASGISLPQEALDLIRTPRYEIEATIQTNMNFVARATASVHRVAADAEWVPFRLFGELRVDSVLWEDGRPATFARGKDATDLWVDFTGAAADSTELTFFYDGDLLEPSYELWTQVRSSLGWYPAYEYLRPVEYRLTFHAPEKYKIAAVGTRVSEEIQNGTVTSVWETPKVSLVTFNIGTFTEETVEDSRIPSLRVLIDEPAHRRLVDQYYAAGRILFAQRGMAQRVGLDLANSFAFFTEVFGPPTVDHFTATEIPSLHGEAFPGLVLLAWSTFQWTAEEGMDEMFRAHEVAHQWWGIGVEPKTDRDRWLSEGFAEYSGLWFMARQLASLDLFHKRLEAMRDDILRIRERAGPTGIGWRAGDSEHPEDYQTMVYEKGAWVLHMLRTMLTNPDTNDDSRFVEMMRDFYMTYRGQRAGTDQFQEVVERHFGGSMEWFFRQWVRGTDIPRYRFAYKLDELENGEYQATLRIRQERVPEDFTMYVPVLLSFGDQGSAVVVVKVEGPVTEISLPILPAEPDELVLNPDWAVLAEVRTEGWTPTP